jgi:ADP-heptose:LPS heptosyltransferase
MRLSRSSNSSFASRSGSSVTKQPQKESKSREKTRAILVSRNTGGIGDMLMITPAIRQIKKENPDVPLIVCTTESYGVRGVLFDTLKHNPYIDNCVKVTDLINYDFQKVYNFNTQQEITLETDLNYPSNNRIDIFLDLAQLKTDDYRPVYVVTEGEKEWAKNWIAKNIDPKRRKLIGIQIHSSTVRRNWPEEKSLFLALSITAMWPDVSVLLFYEGLTKVSDYNYPHVKNLVGMPLRWVGALVNECEAMIIPDSGLLHLAGALSKKCVALFGSNPPESRISHYPEAVGVTLNFPCSPCWYKQCGNQFRCMADIPVDTVLNELSKLLGREITIVALNTMITRIGGIGDLIMMTPALKSLNQFKGKTITVATKAENVPVLKGLPYLEDVIPIGEANDRYKEQTIDLRFKVESPELGGALSTVLYKTVNRVDMFARLMGADLINPQPDVAVDESRIEGWKTKIKYNRKNKYLGIQTTCTSNTRTFAPEYIPELVKLLSEIKNLKVVLLGRDEFWYGRKAKVDVSKIKSRNVINLMNQTEVADLAPVCSLMDYIICPDSSMVHIAGALKKPCIAVYGNMDPALRITYYPTVKVMWSMGKLSCIPCYDHKNPCPINDDLGAPCMRLTTPEMIFKKAKKEFNF